jgi:hypothetical protein
MIALAPGAANAGRVVRMKKIRSEPTMARCATTNGEKMKTNIVNLSRALRRSGVKNVLIGLASLALATSPSLAGNDNASDKNIIPPQAHPLGLSYAEWAARFWQWAFSFPATANPAADNAPAESNQSGPVWFLPSVTGNRTVTRQMTIPAGTFLFFPVLSIYYNNADCPTNTDLTEAELLEQANGAWDFAASLTVCTIDGVEVKGLESPQQTPYRVETDLFYVTVADHDNLIAATGTPCFPDGGTIDTVAVGAFLMVKPLPVGQHTIRIVGAAGPLANPFFVKDATYEITVTP